MPPTEHGELGLIRTIRARVATGSCTTAHRLVRVGIGDDCAVLRPPPGHDILVTTDFSLEGRHFRRDWHPARSVGHRCLARGLSDLAAMGARPLSAFLSLALPATLRTTPSGRRWVEGFLEGLLHLAEATNTPLSGGDTAAAPGDAILADIVLVGSAPRGKALLRSTARPGDALYVTGTLGGSAAELAALSQSPRAYRNATADTTHPHLFPSPRLGVGATLLRRNLATAAIDLSDGLSTDLHHLCEASNVGALVDADTLPLQASLDLALHGGEDYELLFTARPETRIPRTLAQTPITRIGTITQATGGIRLQTGEQAHPLKAAGWEHHL